MKGVVVNRSEVMDALEAVGGLKRSGSWQMGFCPAHRDGQKSGRRSLGLSDASVLVCFAGCEPKEVIASLAERAGKEKSVFWATGRIHARPRDGEGDCYTVEAIYQYRDTDGRLVAEKCRTRPKSFRWRLPGTRDWNGLQDLRIEDLPLFGAELLAGIEPGSWIYFTEGERAALAVRQAGLPAVCLGGGSSNRDFGMALHALQGYRVAIWPDNDPPGRRYAFAVQRALAALNIENRIINVPVPYKGDAYDFFALGGSAGDIVDAKFSKPVVEYISDDIIAVLVQTELGLVRFQFEDMMYERRVLACELMVIPELIEEPIPYQVRAENILSVSWRASNVKMLREFFGDADWGKALTVACSAARTAFDEARSAQDVAAVEVQAADDSYLIEGVIPDNNTTVVFGDGDSGKTYLAYAMAVSVATGVPILGIPVHRGNVLILDWETDQRTATQRLARIAAGAGFDRMPGGIFYLSTSGIPLPEIHRNIKRIIHQNDIRLIVIDSGGPAQGDDPLNPGRTIGFFNTVKRLGCAALIICHTTKGSGDSDVRKEKPFGSVYWHNMPRRTWYVEADRSGGENVLNVIAVPRKANDGKRGEPLSYTVSFGTAADGPVFFTPTNFRRIDSFMAFMPLTERVWVLLDEVDQPMAQHEIAQALGISGKEGSERLGAVLRWGEKHQWFERIAVSGRGGSSTFKWVAVPGHSPLERQPHQAHAAQSTGSLPKTGGEPLEHAEDGQSALLQ